MIPFSDLDTISLDVGNTIISIDFDWVAAELCARGVACSADGVRRAEAAARPSFSHQVFVEGLPVGLDGFEGYLAAILGSLPAAQDGVAEDRARLAAELRPVLRPAGRANVLWRSVMPRVPDALDRLRRRGLRLIAVSNSDGTAEESIRDAGLRAYFDAVIDSAIVGYEKPDPRIFAHALADFDGRPRRACREFARAAPRSVRRLAGDRLRARRRSLGRLRPVRRVRRDRENALAYVTAALTVAV